MTTTTTAKFEIVDREDNNAVVAQFPTHRKALNASNRLEPTPSGAPLGYTSFDGQTLGWRYLIRPVTKSPLRPDRRASIVPTDTYRHLQETTPCPRPTTEPELSEPSAT